MPGAVPDWPQAAPPAVPPCDNRTVVSLEQPRWLDDDEQLAWRTFLRASSELMAALDADLLPQGVSLSEYEILAMLSEEPDSDIRMSVLADLVSQSRSRLTHAANRLERRGWVARQRSERDGRGVLLSLTPEGRAAVGSLAPVHLESVRARLVDLLTREELLELGRLMQVLRGGEPSPARRAQDACPGGSAGS